MSSSFPQSNRISYLKAGADLSGKQYCAVQVEADGDVNLSGANEQDNLGFLMNKPTSGEPCEVAIVGGGALGIAAGTIVAGDYLTTDANGHLVAVAAGETKNAAAFALTSAADNDVFAILVLTPGQSVIRPA